MESNTLGNIPEVTATNTIRQTLEREERFNVTCFFIKFEALLAFTYTIIVSHMPVISIINRTEYVNIFLNIERFNIKTEYMQQFKSQRKEEK